MPASPRLAYAVFDNEQRAANAVDALVQHDFAMDGISVFRRANNGLEDALVDGAAGPLTKFEAGMAHARDAVDVLATANVLATLTQGTLLVGTLLVAVRTQDDAHVEAARTALQTAGASEVHVRPPGDGSVAAKSGEPEGGDLAARERAHRKEAEQRIDETLAESFPASDPPFWTSGWNGPPTPTPEKR